MMAGTGRLTGRAALVTGGAAGIGLATARLLAAEGAAVAIGDLAGYDEAAAELQAAGRQALGVHLDVTNAESVRVGVAAIVERLGGLQVLVNNAGIDMQRRLEDLAEAEWDSMMAVNLKGPFLCIQAAAPHLALRGGAVVNVSSLAGRSASPLQGCHYSASKAGLLGLTRHLARELGPRGIRVNAICPGPVETALLQRSAPAERLRELADQVPLGRLGTPDDIARAIVFLASDDAAYVNGASLDANGGIFTA